MFEVAAVFSDHCVLQREKNICVFGYGEDGKSVFVKLLDKKNGELGKNTTALVATFISLLSGTIFFFINICISGNLNELSSFKNINPKLLQ